VYWSDMYLWDGGKGDGLVKWRKDSPSHMLGENILGDLKFGASVERHRDGCVVSTEKILKKSSTGKLLRILDS
jgi:hypothetical protein